MDNEIKPINKNSVCFFIHKRQRFFFFYPTISREVESIIASLKTHKVHRFLDVDAKFLK